jgi:hypothetical protein
MSADELTKVREDMKLVKAIFAGALGAIGIQPLLFGLWFLLPGELLAPFPLTAQWVVLLLLYALLVAVALVFILGVPAFLALRRINRANWRWVAAVGLLIGAASVGVVTWPLGHSGYTSGGNWFGHDVSFYVDGVPTLYGWLGYFQGVLIFGIHGLVGGLVFYYGWRRQSGGHQPVLRN